MNKRLQQFLTAENISQAQFAESINVARASISHILAGRNKPGFDFIESVSRNYPTLNLEWLITGKGKMYKNATVSAPSIGDDDLFAGQNAPEEAETSPTAMPENIHKPLPSSSVKETAKPSPSRCIEKVIVFYSDGTYQDIK